MTLTTDSLTTSGGIPSNDAYFEAIIRQDVAALQQIITADPQDYLAQFSLATAYEQQGLTAEATAIYRQLVAADENGFYGISAQNSLAAIAGQAIPLFVPSLPKVALAPPPTVFSFLGGGDKKLRGELSRLLNIFHNHGEDWASELPQVDWQDPQVVGLVSYLQNIDQKFQALYQTVTDLEAQRRAEAQQQKQERLRVQEAVINLLLDIEGAQRGDLTVRAKVDEGEMGSIADAFNATVRSLRDIVMQVQAAANQVQDAARSSETSVQRLSTEARTQAEVIANTLESVANIAQSIQTVAASAQEAAQIARQARESAQVGDQTMDATVDSMENIRTSVAETSKRMKRLAESSQEVSKIVNIISGISEKTNLLAFNASIEAARAGENGQGFRVVADEVRRLAERVTDSTHEIEQLVTGIQQETADVLSQMEASTTQVVKGTQLVAQTKDTLQGLASISQEIDALLESISKSTVSQTEASLVVNETIQEVATIAQTTSSESEGVASSMQTLVSVAEKLQSTVSRFQVD
ncbi:methyl-accepting chemotaxis protein [Synechococcus sp. PCC 6312]|uniref:methyl-accepting chemotaxis protein n=1 Tax=Synechococcus sp. (strain ATCC 27167 / PCC 6312) TaxID=195253 RepID=UPI00029F4E20|nr:methyl-accepting chemotaxis protein [Synechococcus sp. PCC 6312]AFY62687.1 methyl-accepting chemotaxis protein [Synechococcus sp. PCC 6312]